MLCIISLITICIYAFINISGIPKNVFLQDKELSHKLVKDEYFIFIDV